MIPDFAIQRSTALPHPTDWQDELKNLVTNPEDLKQLLQLPDAVHKTMPMAAGEFPLRIPRAYLDRIPTRNINHPLLKQFIPRQEELIVVPGFNADPVEEADKNTLPGLVHKYKGRVLLLISSSCPVHCRYCFRRHFPYSNNRNGREEWQKVLDYIRADHTIHEVIYSGGDPLSAPDHQLAWLTAELAAIPHLKRLRVHTRYPVMIPERITNELLDWLSGTRLLPALVLHCNHPEELADSAVRNALAKLRASGVTLLNQSVLLKDVNDSVETLVSLSESLHECGVLPYYLHLLDKVQGAAHFDVPEADALALYHELQALLPGYLLPKLVREEPGKSAKSIRG